MTKFKGRLIRRKRVQRRANRRNLRRFFGVSNQIDRHTFTRWATSSAINTNGGFSTAITDLTGEALTLTGPFVTYERGTGGTSGDVTYAAFGVAFTLSDVAAAAEFTALFDQYRLMKVKFLMYPVDMGTLSTGSGVAAGAAGYPTAMIHSVLDYDDNDPPLASEAGLLTMMEKTGYKMRPLQQIGRPVISRTFRPRALGVINNAAGATTARSLASKDSWMDVASPLIPHFGLKGLIEMHSGTNATDWALQFRIIVKYWLQLKGVR